MLIAYLQDQVHTSNVAKGHKAEPAWPLSPLILQDYDIVNCSKLDEVISKLWQLQVVRQTTNKYFSQLRINSFVGEESTLWDVGHFYLASFIWGLENHLIQTFIHLTVLYISLVILFTATVLGRGGRADFVALWFRCQEWAGEGIFLGTIEDAFGRWVVKWLSLMEISRKWWPFLILLVIFRLNASTKPWTKTFCSYTILIFAKWIVLHAVEVFNLVIKGAFEYTFLWFEHLKIVI